MPKSRLFLALALILAAACPPADEEIEGDEAGECSDGVDNDQDGSTDCTDAGCAAATDCTGDDDDATSDDDDATGDDDDSAGDDDDDSAGDDDDSTPPGTDDDGDGITVEDGDCDDSDPSIYPGAPEIWDDGIDQDCDGVADAAGSACNATFTVDFPDGSATTLDGCLAWSLNAAFEYDPDDPPEIRSFTLTFQATAEKAFECNVVIEQGQICETGYFDAAHDAASYSTALMDCSGVSDDYELEYPLPLGYLRLDVLDAGPVPGNFSGQPLATTVEGYLDVDDGTGVHVSGSFAVTIEQIATDEDEQTQCAGGTDGDEDDDGAIDVYFGGTDCDDADPANFPGNPELCDGQDNDCNGLDDAGNPGVTGQETDGDGDGQSVCEGDCDNADGQNLSGGIEVCDGSDNDCNGFDDYNNPGVAGAETDNDGDGQTECITNDANVLDNCNNDVPPLLCGIDCDDTDPANFEFNVELCDGQDNDCNGLDDAGNPGVAGQEVDSDGDGILDCDE